MGAAPSRAREGRRAAPPRQAPSTPGIGGHDTRTSVSVSAPQSRRLLFGQWRRRRGSEPVVVAYEERVVPPRPRPRPAAARTDTHVYDTQPENDDDGDNATHSTTEVRAVMVRAGRTHVFLSQRRLVAVAPGLERLAAAVVVDLSHNRLVTLGSDFAGMARRLRLLRLNDNVLTAVPPSLGALTALTGLDLSRNALETLPDALGGLVSLTHCNVSHNRLQALPHTLGRLTQLRLLRVDNNRLVALPIEVAQLPRLHTLSGTQNPWLVRGAAVTIIPSATMTAAMAPRAPASGVPTAVGCEVPTLRDLAARGLVLHLALGQLEDMKRLPVEVRAYMLGPYQLCSQCGSPFFGPPVLRYRFLRRFGGGGGGRGQGPSSTALPFVYALCRPHWHSEADRLRCLFGMGAGAATATATPHGTIVHRGGRAQGASVATVKPATTASSVTRSGPLYSV
jgi:hypothetical protein